MVEVVVDGRLSASRFAARSYAEAPDVDGIIRLAGRKLLPGQFLEVEITGAEGYDLEARPRGKAPRGKNRHGQTP